MKPLYLKAAPQFCDLDSQEGGGAFARQIAEKTSGKEVSHLIINLCGEVYLDYWGCSVVADECIDVLATHFNRSGTPGRVSIITSFRNEERAEYAWLFFYKSKHLGTAQHTYEEMAARAIDICKAHNLVFEIFVKDFTFTFDSYSKLGNADVTLSSK